MSAAHSWFQEAEVAFNRLRDAIEAEKSDAHNSRESYAECFKQPHLRRTLLVVFGECLPLLFGLSLLGSSSYFQQQIGMEPGTSVMYENSWRSLKCA